MRLDQERLDSFQSRMSDWVGRQGLLFQLRYAGTVRGARRDVLGSVLRLAVRLVILLVLLGVAFWVFLLKRVDLQSFRKDLDHNMTSTLGCEELELRGVRHRRGSLELSAVNAIGGDTSFFEDLELRGVKMLMGLADGIFTPWNSEVLTMQSLKVRLKSGADTDEEASKSYESLFWESADFKVRSIQVSQANLQWGYSESNEGAIVGSRLTAVRQGASWQVVLRGGHFSQNWLQRLEIERIEAELRPDGWVVHEARLKQGEGTVGFTLKLAKGGAVPFIEGSGSFEAFPLGPFIAPEYRDMVDGTLSGSFDVQGSTNSQSGFEILWDVVLNGENDRLEIRDRLPILRAISTADRFRTYKKVRFRTGGFRMKTGGGVLEAIDLALEAPRLMRLEGAMAFRPPTAAEIDAELDLEERSPVGILLQDESEEPEGDAFEFSLRTAAEGSESNSKDGEESAAERLSTILGDEGLSKRLSDRARERQREVHRVDGQVRLGVLPSALERTPELAEAFPEDAASGLRWLPLSFGGVKVFNLTEAEAERVFSLSKRQP